MTMESRRQKEDTGKERDRQTYTHTSTCESHEKSIFHEALTKHTDTEGAGERKYRRSRVRRTSERHSLVKLATLYSLPPLVSSSPYPPYLVQGETLLSNPHF